MITEQLIHPRSIAVIGASNDVQKPGGKVLANLLAGSFGGPIYPVNRKEAIVQRLTGYPSVQDLPEVDLAILAIPAAYCVETMQILAESKRTRGFIVLSAGFAEVDEAGAAIEAEMVRIADTYGAGLIGPNCIGVLTEHYNGVFTTPIPTPDPAGCTLVSGSGATAVFIMEAGTRLGLKFSQVFSVGNSAQNGVEEVLQYLDGREQAESDSANGAHVGARAADSANGADLGARAATASGAPHPNVPPPSGLQRPNPILLYIESITNPAKLLQHARSLRQKGHRLAAVKAGSSEAGSRAASSHTGALAGSDAAVDALFRKAGIIRCRSREELTTLGAVLSLPPLPGPGMAVITHAGGPAVMLTDALSDGGLSVPPITGAAAEELKAHLYPASSVANPIDFLATGTAEQLGTIIDYCDRRFDGIDAMAVIFGSPGLFPVDAAYQVLHEKMRTSIKPIYPVLPSIVNAGREVKEFYAKGNVGFPDEVALARALAQVHRAVGPFEEAAHVHGAVGPFEEAARSGAGGKRPSGAGAGRRPAAVHRGPDISTMAADLHPGPEGYLSPEDVGRLLDAAGIPRVPERVTDTEKAALTAAESLGYPVVMKAVGPVHKSDVGGVVVGVADETQVRKEFARIMAIPETTAVLIQPMAAGTELFAGGLYEPPYGHLIAVGLGGVFVEVLKDVAYGLAPLGPEEAEYMIRSRAGFDLIQGTRGQPGINQDQYIGVITALSNLVTTVPQIVEMDLNPLLASGDTVLAVDARIRVKGEFEP